MQVCHLLSPQHVVFLLHYLPLYNLKDLNNIYNDFLFALFAFTGSIILVIGIIPLFPIPLKITKDSVGSREVNMSE